MKFHIAKEKAYFKFSIAKKAMLKKWFKLMKPLANFISKMETKKRNRHANTPIKKTKKWTAAMIMKDAYRWLQSHPTDSYYILLSDKPNFVFNDEYNYDFVFRDYFLSSPASGMSKKKRRAFNAAEWTVDLQRDVIQLLKQEEIFRIEEEYEKFQFEENRPKGYVTAVKLNLKK